MITFISYPSDIKGIAEKIKAYLDEYDFNCFLAHEDIPPQTVWPAEIDHALQKCDLFLPLLTPEFTTSFYCQQETGFAYCRKVEIVPIMISTTPMGMLTGIQVVKFNENNFEDSCWKIIEHVAEKTTLSEQIVDVFIREFGETSSYDDSCEWAEYLLNHFTFTLQQVKTIKSHIQKNSQINETKKARDCIFKFMKEYPTVFDDDFVKWYDKKSRIQK